MECCSHMAAAGSQSSLRLPTSGFGSSSGQRVQPVSAVPPGCTQASWRIGTQNAALPPGEQKVSSQNDTLVGCNFRSHANWQSVKTVGSGLGAVRFLSGVALRPAASKAETCRNRGLSWEGVQCQASSGPSTPLATNEPPKPQLDLPANGASGNVVGPILGSKPSYVPLPSDDGPKGPQLTAKPQILRPVPPPTPPPTPPNPASSGPSFRAPTNRPRPEGGRQFVKHEAGKVKPPVDNDARPKFVFRQRDNRPRPAATSSSNGAAQSLREILEKAERMGNNGNANGSGFRSQDAAAADRPLGSGQARGFPWDLDSAANQDGRMGANGSATLASEAASGSGEEVEGLFGLRGAGRPQAPQDKEAEPQLQAEAAEDGEFRAEAQAGNEATAPKPLRPPPARPVKPPPVAAAAAAAAPLRPPPRVPSPPPPPPRAVETPAIAVARAEPEVTTTLFTFDDEDEEEAVVIGSSSSSSTPPAPPARVSLGAKDSVEVPGSAAADEAATVAEAKLGEAPLDSSLPVGEQQIEIPRAEEISPAASSAPAAGDQAAAASAVPESEEVLRNKPERPQATAALPRSAPPPVRPSEPLPRASRPQALAAKPAPVRPPFTPQRPPSQSASPQPVSATSFRPSRTAAPPVTPSTLRTVPSQAPSTAEVPQLKAAAAEEEEEAVVVKPRPVRTEQAAEEVPRAEATATAGSLAAAAGLAEAVSGEERGSKAAGGEEAMPSIRPRPVPAEPVLKGPPRVALRGPPVLRPPPRPAEPAPRPAARGPRLSKPPIVTEGAGDVRKRVPREGERKKEGAPTPPQAAPIQALGGADPSKAPKKGKEVKLRGKKQYGKEEEGDGKQLTLTRKQSREKKKAARAEAAKANAPVKSEILEVGPAGMAVPELAGHLAVNEADVIRTLFMKGIAITVNQTLDFATVQMACSEYEVEVIEAGSVPKEQLAKRRREFLEEGDLDSLQFRPPVVTIMGHVDHGKTSLLDHIRKSKVAAGEAGGITQGIGAYRVKVEVGGEEQMCVFLDTPGHEAFSAMRARGARVTDIAVIVVAADDGVRPQTLEAIAHARAANVPIVVAINKVDKVGASPERVMQELAGQNLMPEEWGGDVPMVPVSALTGQGMEDLLENIMLQAEVQELRANPDRDALGTVIEASLDKNRGPVATLLVQNGTLRKGDVVLCGEAFGKVRALTDDTGLRADSAGPSMAVEILGLSTVPVAGDEFRSVASLEEARMLAEQRADSLRLERLTLQAGEGKVTLASVASAVAANQEAGSVEHHSMNLVLKVDAQGSVEAVRGALAALPQDTVRLRFLLQAPGEVSSSDVDLALASEAIVLGFNVGCPPAVQTMADDKGVEVRRYRVIYDLVDDLRKAMEGMLQTAEERVPVGQAEVRAVFGTGSSKVAGCMVTEGKLVKGCSISVRRGSKEVYSGTLDSLRRVKEAAKEVVAGLECGLGVDDFDAWAEGDVIDAFTLIEKNRTLEDASKGNELALAGSFGQA